MYKCHILLAPYVLWIEQSTLAHLYIFQVAKPATFWSLQWRVKLIPHNPAAQGQCILIRNLDEMKKKHRKSAKLPWHYNSKLFFCLFVFLSFCPDITPIKCLRELKCQKSLSVSKFKSDSDPLTHSLTKVRYRAAIARLGMSTGVRSDKCSSLCLYINVLHVEN